MEASAAKPSVWGTITNFVHRAAEAAKSVGKAAIKLPSKMVDFVKQKVNNIKNKYRGTDYNPQYDRTMPPGATGPSY